MSRLLAAALALTSCGPLPRKPQCVEVPVPEAEDFAACGGITYHVGPGPIVPHTIAFKNEMSDSRFELVSVCVLVDGYSLLAKNKLEWKGNLFRGKHVIKVQAVYKSRSSGPGYVTPMTFTIRSAQEIASTGPGVLELIAYEQGGPTDPIEASASIEKRPALRWVNPKGSTCE